MEKSFPPSITKLLSIQIEINTLFKNINRRKRRICDKNIHTDMKIPAEIYQRNEKFFVTVKPKHACKLEFADHLWLPFLIKFSLTL